MIVLFSAYPFGTASVIQTSSYFTGVDRCSVVIPQHSDGRLVNVPDLDSVTALTSAVTFAHSN